MLSRHSCVRLAAFGDPDDVFDNGYYWEQARVRVHALLEGDVTVYLEDAP